jgi:hypothetical protein
MVAGYFRAPGRWPHGGNSRCNAAYTYFGLDLPQTGQGNSKCHREETFFLMLTKTKYISVFGTNFQRKTPRQKIQKQKRRKWKGLDPPNFSVTRSFPISRPLYPPEPAPPPRLQILAASRRSPVSASPMSMLAKLLPAAGRRCGLCPHPPPP